MRLVDQITSIPLLLSLQYSIFITEALQLTLLNVPTLGGTADVQWRKNSPNDKRGFFLLRSDGPGDHSTVIRVSQDEMKDTGVKHIPILELGRYHVEALTGDPPQSSECDARCRSAPGRRSMGSTQSFVVSPGKGSETTKSSDTTATTTLDPSNSTSESHHDEASAGPSPTPTGVSGQEEASDGVDSDSSSVRGGLKTSPSPPGSLATEKALDEPRSTDGSNSMPSNSPHDRQNPSGSTSRPNQGTVIGAVVGSIIFALLAALLLVLCRRRRRKRDTQVFSEKMVWSEGRQGFQHSRTSTAILDDLPQPEPLAPAFAKVEDYPYNQQPRRQSRPFSAFHLPKIIHTPPTPSVSSASTKRFSLAKFSRKPLPSPLGITPEIFSGRVPSPPPTEAPFGIYTSRTARQLEIQEKIIELQRKLLGMQKWVRRLSGGSAMTTSSDGTVTENEDFARVRRNIEELEILMNSAWALGRSDVVPRAMLDS